MGGSSEDGSVHSPFARDGDSALVPRDVADVGVSAYLAEVDRFLPKGPVETCRGQRGTSVRARKNHNFQHLQGGVTESGGEQVGSELSACPSIQEGIHKLAVVLAKAGLIANVVEFTWEAKRRGSAQQGSRG